MNYFFFGYRDWSLSVFDSLKSLFPNITLTLFSDSKRLSISDFCPDTDIFIFVGWSEIISSDFVSRFQCFCIHPSPLPLYRGGSPIQHQIISGEHMSAVTLFQMDSGCDTGPIFLSYQISLDGFLDEVLQRISSASTSLISSLIFKFEGGSTISLTPQDSSSSTYCKRRQPSDSIVSLSEFSEMSSVQVFNHIRCLQPPYPPFQIKYPDGSILTLLNAELS